MDQLIFWDDVIPKGKILVLRPDCQVIRGGKWIDLIPKEDKDEDKEDGT